MQIEIIKKKIDELEELADEIENYGIKIIENFPFKQEKYINGYTWGIPSEEIKKLQSQTVRLYQKWYSTSLLLITEYIKEREKEFKDSLIMDYLQPGKHNPYGVHSPDRQETINSLIDRFDIQRGILLSVSGILEVKEINLRKLISADFVETELEEAEILFKNNYTRAAGTLARVALEKHLKTMCDLNNVSYKHKDTINTLVSNLYGEGFIDKTEFKKIQYLADIGNDCSHPNPIDENRVKELIDGVKKFV